MKLTVSLHAVEEVLANVAEEIQQKKFLKSGIIFILKVYWLPKELRNISPEKVWRRDVKYLSQRVIIINNDFTIISGLDGYENICQDLLHDKGGLKNKSHWKKRVSFWYRKTMSQKENGGSEKLQKSFLGQTGTEIALIRGA